MEQADTIIQIPHFYGSLKGMQDKFDKYARQDAFAGSTREEWEAWKETSRETLKDLLGSPVIWTHAWKKSWSWRTAFVGKK